MRDNCHWDRRAPGFYTGSLCGIWYNSYP